MTDREVFDLLVDLDDKSRNGNLVERTSASLRLKEEVLLNFESLLRLAGEGIASRNPPVKLTDLGRKIDVDFNVNYDVLVKLTDIGRDIDERWALYTDEDGWTKYQMWDLMAKFGNHIRLGFGAGSLPFQTGIRLDLRG